MTRTLPLDQRRGSPAYYRLSVRDLDVSTPEQMHRILDLIDAEHERCTSGASASQRQRQTLAAKCITRGCTSRSKSR